MADPADSMILINDKEYSGGSVALSVKPDNYTVVVRRPSFREFRSSFLLVSGQRHDIEARLEPLPGMLNVSPNVAGGEIIVTNLETGAIVGSYRESVSGMALSPSRYEIKVVKEGYKAATREVAIRPDETAYLEPQLERLPGASRGPLSASPVSVRSYPDGKFLIVTVSGRSGDPSQQVGSLDVSVAGGGGSVGGALPGFPCKVEFVRIENVAESAFTEPPGPGNQWSLVAVRVRPKDSKRPVHFSINWRALQPVSERTSGEAQTSAEPAAADEPAVAVRKVTPTYPSQARSLRVSGVVFVSMEIDELGDVVSAHAVEGPPQLMQAAESAARQWKFRPATHGGRPIRSMQSVRFNFQP